MNRLFILLNLVDIVPFGDVVFVLSQIGDVLRAIRNQTLSKRPDMSSLRLLQLGTVHLCRSVIRSIETARVFDFEEFPTRDRVSLFVCSLSCLVAENTHLPDCSLSW